MLVEFGKSSLISKARQQPDKVKQVLDKIKTEGLIPTLEAVFNKLDEPLPLGYCNAGEVISVGDGVTEFSIGDRVASNGAHAQFVCVPKNLAAKIPDDVSYDEACFTVIGSIGLQGIRLAAPTIGETFVVIGLGLIGLLTAQLLVANGCRVLGFDFDESKIALAKKNGIEAFNSGVSDSVKVVDQMTGGIGADAVIITASTKDNGVISQSAQMSRKRGRIILIGVIGLDIQRSEFYKKELTFQVSCSYGPGRYDEEYEFKGSDYPIAFVRWTEKRNFETVLQAISRRQIDVASLITDKVSLDNYLDIYNNLKGRSVASIIEYPNPSIEESASKVHTSVKRTSSPTGGIIGVIGAGNFTKMTMMPAIKRTRASLRYIASAGGLTAKSLAGKYGFEVSTTDYQTILKDTEVDLVLITTRHDQHARMVVNSLKAGKHVFVEKPLAITQSELDEIISVYHQLTSPLSVTVGFNRRFSAFSIKAKQLLGIDTPPINMIATINAGHIPLDVWVHDMKTGGGRIIGEACHFIDLMSFFSGSYVKSVHMSALGINPVENTDNAIITLKFDNGSQGVISYFANGNKRYPKERIEIYAQERTLVIDNFRSMKGYGFKSFSSMSSSIDKGHKEQFTSLLSHLLKGGESLIDFDSLVNTSRASLSAIESLKSGQTIFI
ncbi:bi-domain-containing oxidoreductase [Sediminibacterium soli]|uniref:bi-domain-containing oxidoreductase n=1 Tax=Sediminibacterium soli TaxID=2698829 RepID=UPI00192A4E60|nr:bi-domain-containing oxidoreductase [Sediminibacterium soli]